MDNLSSPITPTVGRVVLVRGAYVNDDEPTREFPALVTRVWSDNCINVHIFNERDGGLVATSVTYNSDPESHANYVAWRWMDYQLAAASDRSKAVSQ